MKKLFFLILPILSILSLNYGCDEIFGDPDCAEGLSRITVTRVDGSVCCPEGCTCLTEADQKILTEADAFKAPNDTISVDPTNPGGGDPIDEDCGELSDQRGFIVDEGSDGEMLISFHDGDFEALKASGKNLIEEESFFTRVYNVNLTQFDPYFITIVKSETNNKIIRIGYNKETLFVNRISLN